MSDIRRCWYSNIYIYIYAFLIYSFFFLCLIPFLQISDADFDLLKCDSERQELRSRIVQSPDKLQVPFLFVLIIVYGNSDSSTCTVVLHSC